MKKYIGIKMITAELEGENYKVIYGEGLYFFQPKDIFERTYMSIEDETTISLEDVKFFMGEPTSRKIDSKTTLVSVETKTGFVQHETASCVDPVNFNVEIGKEIATEKISNRLFDHLGFVLQWARFGLK